MKTYLLKAGVRQAIAKAGETDIAVAYNAKTWIDEYPAGNPQLMVTTPGGKRVPVTVEAVDNLITGQVPNELLAGPGVYSYVFVWTSGSTQLESGRCEFLVLGSNLAKDLAHDSRRTPDWAERIFLAAEVIEGAVNGAMEARNTAADMAAEAETYRAAAENAQEAAETAQEGAEAAEQRAIDVRNSIPETYTELSDKVDDLKSAVDPLSKGINTEGKIYPYAVVDKNGKAALVLDEDGYAILKQKYLSTEANKLSINDGTGNTIVTQDTTGLFDYAVCDQDGKILFYVDSGVLHVKEIESDNVSLALDSMNKRQAKELNADRNKACNLDAEINMFIAYGQSWACGYDANAISTTQKYDNIMFDIGIKNDPLTDMEQTATSFIPMVEESTTSNGAGSQTTGETPVSAMCGMIKQLLQEENGYAYTDVKYQMLGICPGMGSTSLAELSKNTDYYNRLIAQVQMAYNIATELGKKLVVQAFSWQQGDLGYGLTGTYAENLEQLRLDIDTDVKAITGQTQDVKCITWQTMLYTSGAAEDFYQRYVGASETYPNIICSGAAYQFKHVADNNLHLKSVDQDWAGAYLGLAYKRTIIDGTKFVPLKPIKAEIVGKSVYLKFDVPVKPIVFDTDTVTAADNKGFGLTNSGGTAKTISGVEIIAPDIIKITSSATIDGTDKISYGQNAGGSFGPTSGNRGNVRDSQGETIICTAGNGETIPLHNWLVCFNKTINDLMA